MHLKTYLVYMFLLLQFLPLPEIVALDSKQSNALSQVGERWWMGKESW